MNFSQAVFPKKTMSCPDRHMHGIFILRYFCKNFNKQNITALHVQAPTDFTSRSKIFRQFKAII